VKKAIFYSLIPTLFFCFFTNCARRETTIKTVGKEVNKINFNSSDTELNKVFAWAKYQALSYSFTKDPVGMWYEAALPGREAFCMRDVSHQAMGAHFIGLDSFTKNMLHSFAQNISESKDWCSYWEINRYGRAAPVDYLNDKDFWYNLPANFDVLDCCYRMYTWTGDYSYINDSVFLNFYRKTVNNYVDRWQIGIDEIMTRSRLLNMKDESGSKSRFKLTRGIPGYNEEDYGFTVGLDLISSEYRAFVSYSKILQLQGDYPGSIKFSEKAKRLLELINTKWWDGEEKQFYTHENKNHELVNLGDDIYVLYWKAINDSTKLRLTLEKLNKKLPKGPMDVIEFQSHLPEILYRYNMNEPAYRQLEYLFQNDRRDYPEASFSVIGAIVTGLMGIEQEIYPPIDALSMSKYVERVVRTTPRLTNSTTWAEISHIPLMANIISVKHEGIKKTILTNNEGPSLIWKACFPGSFENLILNDKIIKATTEKLIINGKNVSWIEVTVGSGNTMIVRIPD
jgi:hypothetical protein